MSVGMRYKGLMDLTFDEMHSDGMTIVGLLETSGIQGEKDFLRRR